VLSDTPKLYETSISDEVRIVTHYDAQTDRWTTTIVGGPIDGWSTTYRDDDEPEAQHAKAIEMAKSDVC
jgi:hypothetical protein